MVLSVQKEATIAVAKQFEDVEVYANENNGSTKIGLDIA